MEKKKTIILLKNIYSCIIVVVFTSLLLLFSSNWEGSKLDILFQRLLIALFFFAMGFFVVKTKKGIMLKFFYKRNGLVFKDQESEQNAVDQIENFGKPLIAIGLAVFILSVTLYLL